MPGGSLPVGCAGVAYSTVQYSAVLYAVVGTVPIAYCVLRAVHPVECTKKSRLSFLDDGWVRVGRLRTGVRRVKSKLTGATASGLQSRRPTASD